MHKQQHSDANLSNKNHQMISYLEHRISCYQVPFKRTCVDAFLQIQDRLELPSKEINRYRSTSIIITVISSIAAFIVLLFGLKSLIVKATYQNTNQDYLSLILPDNSRTILSPSSNIKYFEFNNQRITVLKGDAYFEVKKGGKFKVKTENGYAQVLGTRFEIKSEASRLQVICYDGSVKVHSKLKHETETINKGVLIQFTEKNPTITTRISEKYPKQAYFNRKYDNVKIDQITNQIEDFFGIQIISTIQTKNHFSGSFNTPLYSEALDILCLSMGYQWTQYENSIIKLAVKQ